MKSIVDVRLGKNLRLIRERNQLSVSGMSKKIGVKNRSTYYAWEQARATPSPSMLVNISRTFNVTIDSLLKLNYK